jgi:hypothetical protein
VSYLMSRTLKGAAGIDMERETGVSVKSAGASFQSGSG